MPVSRDCPFCRRTHSGEFEPEVDEAVMRCRQGAPPALRGDLEAWEGQDTLPIPIERELIQRTREAEREALFGPRGP